MGTFTYYLLPIFRRGGFSLNDKLFFAIKEKSIGSKKMTGKKRCIKISQRAALQLAITFLSFAIDNFQE